MLSLSTFLILIDDPSDQELFADVFNSYEKQMLFVADTILNDKHYAEDAVQTALLRIATGIKTLRNLPDDKKRNYVLTAAKNAALDIAKKNNKNKSISFDLALKLKDDRVSDEMESYGNESSVIHIINKLPEKYKDAMYLHFVLEMSEKEVAQALGISINTVRQHIHRGRKKFAELYNEESD